METIKAEYFDPRQPTAPSEPAVVSLRIGRTSQQILLGYAVCFPVLLMMQALFHGSSFFFWMAWLVGPLLAIMCAFGQEQSINVSSIWWVSGLSAAILYLIQFGD